MAETVIGKTLIIDGEISGTEDLIVHGLVRGRVALEKGLVVDTEGRIEGEVEGARVDVAGSMQGNIMAREMCQIRAGGRMEGDIRSKRILIADGAIFRGKVDMDVPGPSDE